MAVFGGGFVTSCIDSNIPSKASSQAAPLSAPFAHLMGNMQDGLLGTLFLSFSFRSELVACFYNRNFLCIKKKKRTASVPSAPFLCEPKIALKHKVCSFILEQNAKSTAWLAWSEPTIWNRGFIQSQATQGPAERPTLTPHTVGA